MKSPFLLRNFKLNLELLQCDNNRPFCLKCKRDGWKCRWQISPETRQHSEGKRPVLDDATTVVGSLAPSVVERTQPDPELAKHAHSTSLPPSVVDTNKISEDLFQINIKFLIAVTGSLSPSNPNANLSDEDGIRLKNSLERLVLWRNGIEPPDKPLDDLLSQSSEVQSSAVSVLLQLGRVIYALVMLAYLDYRGDGLSVKPDELHHFLKEVSIIMEPDSNSSEEEVDVLYSPEMDVGELLEDLDAYLDCLMDLSLALQGPPLVRDPPQLETIYSKGASQESSDIQKATSSKPVAKTLGNSMAIRGRKIDE